MHFYARTNSTATPRSTRPQTDEFAAFLESVRQLRRFDCVVFHDVDLLPTNPFAAVQLPRLLPGHHQSWLGGGSWAIAGPPLPEGERLLQSCSGRWGGVRTTTWRPANPVRGPPELTRPNPAARVTHDSPSGSQRNSQRSQVQMLYLSSKRYRLDGLNSLSYSLVASESRPLYTTSSLIWDSRQGAQFLLIDLIDWLD
uniref:Glyco_transf_7N domain-containing protein n=1 Tax=Macrostomum lignano TaxID=282301 RepID=A0A1I8FR25_9PLAT